jgi:hypothetical protein
MPTDAERLERIREFDPKLAERAMNNDDEGATAFDGYTEPIAGWLCVRVVETMDARDCCGEDLVVEEPAYRLLRGCDCSYDHLDRAEAIMEVAKTLRNTPETPHETRLANAQFRERVAKLEAETTRLAAIATRYESCSDCECCGGLFQRATMMPGSDGDYYCAACAASLIEEARAEDSDEEMAPEEVAWHNSQRQARVGRARELEVENKGLRAENARLREALKPFADAWGRLRNYEISERGQSNAATGEYWPDSDWPHLIVLARDDYVRAAEALGEVATDDAN